MKTYYSTGVVREFARFRVIAYKDDFIVGVAYEKGKRIPHGIYGYFQKENDGSTLMLGKSWNVTKNWEDEKTNFLIDFIKMTPEGHALARKNYKRYLKDIPTWKK